MPRSVHVTALLKRAIPSDVKDRIGIPVTVPHYVSENKSDMRGIKPGWYAMDDDGNLVSGPFSSREECVKKNILPMNGSTLSTLL